MAKKGSQVISFMDMVTWYVVSHPHEAVTLYSLVQGLLKQMDGIHSSKWTGPLVVLAKTLKMAKIFKQILWKMLSNG